MVGGEGPAERIPAGTPARGQRGGRAPWRRPGVVAPLLFLAVLGGAALLGFAAHRLEVESARRELQRQMLAVGRLKAGEIARWREEREEDILGAATGPRMALDVERWVATGRIDPRQREWVRGRIARLKFHGDYLEVAVLAPDGTVLLAAGDDPTALRAISRALARRAIVEETAVLSPLHSPGDAQDPVVVLDLFAPLTAVDARGSRGAGALFYRIDPRRYLYPLIQSWPLESPSAETLLVERDGDSVLFLNDLRFRAGSALRLRRPLAEEELIAAKAARGARGVVEGVDYRGVPVLAAIEAVKGSSWVLVSKIDQSEAYAPLRDSLWLFVLFLAGAAVTAGLAVRTWLRDVREASLRREHEGTKSYVAALEAAGVEREALIASLTKARDDVKTLRGIVPICASCKRIRDDAGYWKQVEAYVGEHTEAQFSHGVCPECAKRLYPELADTPAPVKPGR